MSQLRAKHIALARKHAERSNAVADHLLAQFESLLDSDDLPPPPNSIAPNDSAVILSEPSLTLSAMVARMVRSTAVRVRVLMRWRWRRFVRFVVHVREEYDELRQLDVAMRQDRAASRRARDTKQ